MFKSWFYLSQAPSPLCFQGITTPSPPPGCCWTPDPELSPSPLPLNRHPCSKWDFIPRLRALGELFTLPIHLWWLLGPSPLKTPLTPSPDGHRAGTECSGVISTLPKLHRGHFWTNKPPKKQKFLMEATILHRSIISFLLLSSGFQGCGSSGLFVVSKCGDNPKGCPCSSLGWCLPTEIANLQALMMPRICCCASPAVIMIINSSCRQSTAWK